jgi:manganese/zinc/iron transport system ATP- binding protein
MSSVIAVRDLTVAYREEPVLWDIDLDVPEGALSAIVGPNGAGKSTLLKAMLDLIHSQSGVVRFFDKPYSKARNRIGYVPQRSEVDWDFPTNALDVVLMGLYGEIGWIKRPNRQHKKRALECLEMVGMEEYADRQISQLSGGQRQRVFLARALAQDADLYLMDEPFAGVDAVTEKAIVTLLKELQARGKTTLVVHHDLDSVPEYFDHVIMLNVKLVASGPVDCTFSPENLKATYGVRAATA